MAEKLKNFFTKIKQRRGLLTLLLLIAAGAVAAFFLWGGKTNANDYLTAKAERGNVEVNVSATGTVQAVSTVQVGSQVSGTVQWLGADFNTEVKRGQVIARLDPTVFQAQVDNARASVSNAESALQGAQTDILSQQANLSAAKANQEVARVQRDDSIALVKRYQEIRTVIAGRDIEAAQATANANRAKYEQAGAQVAQVQAAISSAKARLEQSKAQLAQTRAQLQQAAANLDHSIITSPIDGVVISRNIDVGQTVAASLQAPTLFTIANDLTKMQVLASIDEADVGQIKQGIKANFAVDAFPGETFTGEITQLRLNAQTVQNVVTYSAVIEVANPDQKLRPGMTTNITIPVARRENVLTVPNAALRFRPNLSEAELRQKIEEHRQQRDSERNQNAQGGEQANPQGQNNQAAKPSGGQRPQGSGAGQGNAPGQAAGNANQGRQAGANQGNAQEQGASGGGENRQRRDGQMVWVLVGGKTLEPRFIRTGLTNGRVTEIIGGELQEGDVIVTGQNDANGSSNRSQTGTPFGQQPRPGGGGGGRGR